jgi:CRP/FNR family transcriptional regulator, transcriptional activator FtrB
VPESHYSEVKRLDLFAEMQDDSFHRLMRGSFVQNFPPQIDLVTEGEPSDFLHVVLSGSVDLYAAWNGRETRMATLRPVSTFILAATIRNAPYLMSARTTEKSRVALIPSQGVREVFDVDPVFARSIVVELAQCYRSVIKTTKDLKLRTSLERLANHILRQHKAAGGVLEFELDTEKWRLASFLGMTPENLSRAFKSLQAYGVVVSGNRVSIEDPADLERFAKPSPLIDDHST